MDPSTATRGGGRRATVRRQLWLTVLALAALVGCAPPVERAAGDGPVVYVVSAFDGAVTRVAPDSGRVLGAPIPAGAAPWQVAVGASGHLLVTALVGAPRHGHLTFIQRQGRTWGARPLDLEPGAHVAQTAGSGSYAVAAYGVVPAATGAPPAASGPGAACTLALIDQELGAVVRTHGACAHPGEEVRAVAIDGTAKGPVLYAALWRDSPAAEGHGSAAGGRVVALDALSGRVLAATALAGMPVNLVLAPAPGRSGQRLYAVEGRPAVDGGSAGATHAAGGEFALVGLDPATLAAEYFLVLGFPPDRLAVAPDGEHAYAVYGTDLVHLDLVAQRVERLRTLTTTTLGLAVTETGLFLALPYADAVWQLDRRDGRLLHAIRVGRAPVGLTLQ
jgi:hypothetical protein